MRKIIVCGTIAYDNILQFPGLFSEQILIDKIDNLSVSFVSNSITKSKGGTAPNIAYNLSLIGENTVIIGSAGRDFDMYKKWLDDNNIDTSKINIKEDYYTALCFVVTDSSNNQISGFYPGAMSKDSEISLNNIDMRDVQLVVISPSDPTAMVKWAIECQKLNLPYLFDPGMLIPRFSKEDLIQGIRGAKILVSNEYEHSLMLEKTNMTREDILNSVELIVETLGEKGSNLITRDGKVHISAARPVEVLDPTGAGDAYKAGLIKGYLESLPLETIGRMASVSAVYALEHIGTTEHKYNYQEFLKRYSENYGELNLSFE